MKDPQRKTRIREMLNAEGLAGQRAAEKNPRWTAFKNLLGAEIAAKNIPELEITDLPKAVTNTRRWLVPAAALVLAGTIFYAWYLNGVPREIPASTKAIAPIKIASRPYKTGDVFRSGKREIRFLGGNATLSESDEKIRIETTALRADFRLGEKVDMQIRHPLIVVTVTGTSFVFDAKATGGSINLDHGSLAVDLLHPTRATKTITLKAPAELVFSKETHTVTALPLKKWHAEKPLFRYEMRNGETFYAHQLSIDALSHKVELLGGKTQVVAVADIMQVAPSDRE